MNHTRIYTQDLDSPRRELSNGGLGIVATLKFFLGMGFLLASTGRPIQL